MVKFWDKELEDAIKITKRRIAIMEKHGVGLAAIEEKAILKKQEKAKQDRLT